MGHFFFERMRVVLGKDGNETYTWQSLATAAPHVPRLSKVYRTSAAGDGAGAAETRIDARKAVMRLVVEKYIFTYSRLVVEFGFLIAD